MNTEFELSIVRGTELLSFRNRVVLVRFVLLLPIVVQFSRCAVFLTIYCTLIHVFSLWSVYCFSQRQLAEHDNWGYDGVKSKFLTELRAPNFIFSFRVLLHWRKLSGAIHEFRFYVFSFGFDFYSFGETLLLIKRLIVTCKHCIWIFAEAFYFFGAMVVILLQVWLTFWHWTRRRTTVVRFIQFWMNLYLKVWFQLSSQKFNVSGWSWKISIQDYLFSKECR